MSPYEDEEVGFRYPDKFIACTQPVGGTSVGPGTEYPFKMTLEHAMYLYWKIYSFKISGAYTFKYDYIWNDEGEINTVTTVALVGATIDPEFKEVWPPKMSEMVCAQANPLFYGAKEVGSGSTRSTKGAPGGFPITVFGELAILYFKPILRTEEEDDFTAKYYIPFVCTAGLYDDYGGGVATFLSPFAYTGPRIDKPGAFKLIIDGTTYTTSLTGTSETGFGPFNLSLSGTLEVEEADARLAE